jgi:hypothetical protein
VRWGACGAEQVLSVSSSAVVPPGVTLRTASMASAKMSALASHCRSAAAARWQQR